MIQLQFEDYLGVWHLQECIRTEERIRTECSCIMHRWHVINLRLYSVHLHVSLQYCCLVVWSFHCVCTFCHILWPPLFNRGSLFSLLESHAGFYSLISYSGRCGYLIVCCHSLILYVPAGLRAHLATTLGSLCVVPRVHNRERASISWFRGQKVFIQQ